MKFKDNPKPLIPRWIFSIGRENLRFLSEATSSETANDTEDNYTQEKENLYEGHEPTSVLQRGLLMVGSALAALNNPTRSGKHFNWSFLL